MAGVVPKAAVTTCILFIHHMRCIISLVIACVLVVLQVVTVGSELGDKWLSLGRWTSCLDRQWRKEPVQSTSVEALLISLCSVTLHPSIALQGRSKERSCLAAHSSLWWSRLLETHQLLSVSHTHTHATALSFSLILVVECLHFTFLAACLPYLLVCVCVSFSH